MYGQSSMRNQKSRNIAQVYIYNTHLFLTKKKTKTKKEQNVEFYQLHNSK